MEIKFTFDKKLDLSYFRKQAVHYIGKMRELNYRVFMPGYRVSIDCSSTDYSSLHDISIAIHKIKKNDSGEIVEAQSLCPATDMFFSEVQSVAELFLPGEYLAHFQSRDIESTVDRLCFILRLTFKWNKLKAFH